MKISVGKEMEGRTVLSVLRELGFASTMITVLKKNGHGITVDGTHVTVRHILKNSETLTLDIDDSEPSENIVPSDLPLEVVFEDDYFLVVNKPPYMPTHPSHGHYTDTLANAVCFHSLENEPQKGFVFRPVNRLDRNTSGLVLVAKNRFSAGKLYDSMKKGLINKKYIAVLCGNPYPPGGKIETWIRRQKESIITREVCEECPEADYALTEYETLACGNGISAVCASPVTGRTHQLRVHFAHISCPIVGDNLYGKESKEMARQALHASFLSFPHPLTGEMLNFTVPLPDDINSLLILHGIKL